MKNKNRFVAVVVCFLMFCSVGCGKQQSEKKFSTLNYNKIKVSSNFDSAETVCENENWQLLWNNEKEQVMFADKLSGNVWSPLPDGAQEIKYDEDGIPVKNNPLVESAIVVDYYNPTNLSEKEILSSSDASDVYLQKIDNGLRVVYDFSEAEIMLPVEYKLEGNRFTVSVDTKHIADNGKNYVTAVSLAPFMCGVKNDSQSAWLFMPDGCGTLLSVNSLDTVGDSGEKSVYGDDLTDQKFNFVSKTESIKMPVYGMKTGSKAIFAVIESGSEQASICWNVGSTNMGFSSIYSKFKVRGYTTIESHFSYIDAKEVKYFAKSPSNNKFTVAYYSLSGKKADINGMADTYRTYLTEYKGLSENPAENVVSFRYIGAVMQPDFILGIPTSKLFSLTSTSQVTVLTDQLSEKIDAKFYVDLRGFGTTGLDIGKLAGGFTVADKLGGKKGIKKLSEHFKKNDTEWYMDFDIISYSKSGNGFSKNDSAVFSNLQNAWITNYDTVTRDAENSRFYLLSRNKLNSALEMLGDRAKQMKLSGISLSSLSSNVYSDYSETETAIAGRMIEDVKKSFEKLSKKNFQTLSSSANDYAAIASYRVTDVPLYSSAYDASASDVPFYQLVFKGYRSMNSIALNLCSDERNAVLRCVESGIAPSFTFTAEYDNELITSNHSFIFGTDFGGTSEAAINTVNSLSDYLKSVESAKISDYSVLENGVRITNFDNGLYVATNFSEQELQSPYGKIPAKNYIIGKENG